MIRTIIIDDEPLAAGIVREFLAEFPQFEIVDQCEDGFQAMKSIQKHQPDLLFLDVQMPKITGLELLELLDEPPAVIFTTAFDQYALKAFDAQAVDYLLKPFSQDRFRQAIERFLSTQEKEIDTSGIQDMAEKSNRLVVRVKNEIKIIPVSEVMYFEAQDDYIAIHTDSGQFLKKMTLKSLEESLSPDQFARIHRSYMLNLNQITRIEPYERDSYLVFLKNGEKLPVSKTGYARLRQVLGL
ncbi:LytR/AlgR family response regulator transcription factor [Algoriphagus zhangzhouensis]|uniref:Two component transcriptional regulator, LytTR family n=1 Tax=Algoriphagus zhangzhouensis TaxID=1073327 RepID=A0A1M7ZIP0_9BACT|nr:LytTR family DNA-binding domain-containing protein [Algoriphagus zhangzhouensis]TDY43706.1 LytTR family two component transcriptional regulator [Algoriphagus zhangzhouensis]SHO64790.1 two component transcriptional regulator, LytTR family [Algoriphagus zhangzhouensis]